MFEKFGFKDENVIAITKYKDDIIVVPCEDAMSGIYPDYRKAQPIIMGWLESFTLLNCSEYDGLSIDAIIFRKEKDGYEIFFASDSHDGFQPLTDKEE